MKRMNQALILLSCIVILMIDQSLALRRIKRAIMPAPLQNTSQLSQDFVALQPHTNADNSQSLVRNEQNEQNGQNEQIEQIGNNMLTTNMAGKFQTNTAVMDNNNQMHTDEQYVSNNNNNNNMPLNAENINNKFIKLKKTAEDMQKMLAKTEFENTKNLNADDGKTHLLSILTLKNKKEAQKDEKGQKEANCDVKLENEIKESKQQQQQLQPPKLIENNKLAVLDLAMEPKPDGATVPVAKPPMSYRVEVANHVKNVDIGRRANELKGQYVNGVPAESGKLHAGNAHSIACNAKMMVALKGNNNPEGQSYGNYLKNMYAANNNKNNYYNNNNDKIGNANTNNMGNNDNRYVNYNNNNNNNNNNFRNSSNNNEHSHSEHNNNNRLNSNSNPQSNNNNNPDNWNNHVNDINRYASNKANNNLNNDTKYRIQSDDNNNNNFDNNENSYPIKVIYNSNDNIDDKYGYANSDNNNDNGKNKNNNNNNNNYNDNPSINNFSNNNNNQNKNNPSLNLPATYNFAYANKDNNLNNQKTNKNNDYNNNNQNNNNNYNDNPSNNFSNNKNNNQNKNNPSLNLPVAYNFAYANKDNNLNNQKNNKNNDYNNNNQNNNKNAHNTPFKAPASNLKSLTNHPQSPLKTQVQAQIQISGPGPGTGQTTLTTDKLSPVENVLKFANMLLYKMGLDSIPFRSRGTQILVNPGQSIGTASLPEADDFDSIDYLYNTFDNGPFATRSAASAPISVPLMPPFIFQSQFSPSDSQQPFNFLENALDSLLAKSVVDSDDNEDEVELRCPVHYEGKNEKRNTSAAAGNGSPKDLIQVCSCRFFKKKKNTA